jgi:hypothetical protein
MQDPIGMGALTAALPYLHDSVERNLEIAAQCLHRRQRLLVRPEWTIQHPSAPFVSVFRGQPAKNCAKEA